ncbi:adenosylcobinamide-phosphate synthase CbiB [Chamaesiphon sp. OTE_8_metabat_110]|uniref:adenosylcobinamide-phosphate synthase CbiB n=1 Tax=Chamaesiphon sp. OTE_8_metabat_110 TaxID=2964696 RepID=UPI00286C95C1|nr:adenosylcobinamide-phosphate synthase CbiB [Chamaesiphon sp. OTE_8_metabat_110]
MYLTPYPLPSTPHPLIYPLPSTLYPLISPLLLAASLDYLIGDPWGWLHPVQVMGWAIAKYTQIVLKYVDRPHWRRIAGVGLFWGLILGTGGLTWLVIYACQSIHPGLSIIVQSIALASCFAGRSLRRAAEDVLQAIDSGDLATARSQLSMYVGRDTDNLTIPEIYRAILETITENAIDGVMAPLFYAIVGLFIPAVGAVPLAMAYKAASTLDSMVGYRREPYADLGWCSAKSEDVLTWLPCRLAVLTIGLISGKPVTVWRLCWRDAVKDPSPNSGWSECAYAAALDVQVGGINYYKGQIQPKPLLGDDLQPISAAIIQRALSLTRTSFLLWLGVAIALAFTAVNARLI